MRYKLCKFCENRARDTPLRGVYIPDFGQIWVKISILGVLRPCRCTDGGEIWQFHPHRCNVSPLWGEKPQHQPLSKLNTGRFELRAMLPVTSTLYWISIFQQFNPPIRSTLHWITELGMVIEDLEHVLSPLKRLVVWRIVSPLGGTENLGETRPPQL